MFAGDRASLKDLVAVCLTDRSTGAIGNHEHQGH